MRCILFQLYGLDEREPGMRCRRISGSLAYDHLCRRRIDGEVKTTLFDRVIRQQVWRPVRRCPLGLSRRNNAKPLRQVSQVTIRSPESSLSLKFT